MKDNLIYQIQQLLAYCKIHFDKKELAFQIQSHPAYPSLYATTSMLSHFDIENLALSIPNNLETLKQLPKTFLAQINTEDGKSFTVVNKEEKYCTILTVDKKKKRLTYTEFLEKFTGIIVVVKKDEHIAKSSKNNIDKTILILSTTLLLTLLSFSAISIWSFLYFVLSAVSILISNTIIEQEQGHQTSLGNALCSATTEKKDCDAVLTSEGALLFNRFKLSSISLVYFTSLTLSSLLLFLRGYNLDILFVISLSALPITIYSIYYQSVKVKKWCMLCLGIVVILWAQITIASVNLQFNNFSIESVLLTVFGFLVATLFWNQLRPKLKSLKELDQTKIDYFKFKRNYNLFKVLLEKSAPIDTSIHTTSEIVLGNNNAPLNITIVTNPFCGHCKPVHALVENILKKHHNEVQIYVRFNVNTANLENDALKVSSRLLEIYNNTEERDTCLTAMRQIYEGMPVTDWLSKWGECSEKENYTNILKQESAWCTQNAINFTPEILINGRSFPKEYDRTDLIYFIEELSEDFSKTNSEFELIA